MKKYTDNNDLELLSETALESSLAGFWDWNILTNEEYLSPRFKEMFGYKEHEMENKPEAWQKIAFQEDLPNLFEVFQNHIDSKGIHPFISTIRYHHKNGGTVWVKCNGKVVEWTESGKPSRAIGCHIDVTEEKELEIKLKKAIAERDTLLSEVHHRVKNNLQLILSLARMKQKDGKIDVREIGNSISSIASAYEAIYQTDRFDELIISDYLNNVVRPLIQGYDINFRLAAESNNKTIDFLIPIGLIISECISNTIKHAYPKIVSNGVVDLFIREAEDSFKIIYKDNGRGFSKAIINSTNEFDSFGLSIIISLVKQLDGEIQLSNEDGAKIEIKIKTDSKNLF